MTRAINKTDIIWWQLHEKAYIYILLYLHLNYLLSKYSKSIICPLFPLLIEKRWCHFPPCLNVLQENSHWKKLHPPFLLSALLTAQVPLLHEKNQRPMLGPGFCTRRLLVRLPQRHNGGVYFIFVTFLSWNCIGVVKCSSLKCLIWKGGEGVLIK